jgi:hypothetical protein
VLATAARNRRYAIIALHIAGMPCCVVEWCFSGDTSTGITRSAMRSVRMKRSSINTGLITITSPSRKTVSSYLLGIREVACRGALLPSGRAGAREMRHWRHWCKTAKKAQAQS